MESMANLHEDDLEAVNSWSEAVLNSKGYTDESLITDLIGQFKANALDRFSHNPIVYLTQRQSHLLLAFLKLLNSKEVYSIGDFGGGNGYMCDFLRTTNPNTKIIYDVYETADIAEGYANFGKELEINFIDAKNWGKKNYDMVIISCTLQYIENWEEILTVSSQITKNVLLMRLPLTDAEDHKFFIQHNNSGIYHLSRAKWPIILFSKSFFFNTVQKIFDIVFELSDTEENYEFGGKDFPMTSLLLKSK
jgi:putative methyltransferase (TIGR04325 family)